METPRNMEGYRTERIMAVIKQDVFDGKMETPLYNKIYSAVYRGLEECSTKNVIDFLSNNGIYPPKA